MKNTQQKGSAERRLYALSTGLLTVLALSGCMSSSFESSFDPKLVSETRAQQQKQHDAKPSGDGQSEDPAAGIEPRDGSGSGNPQRRARCGGPAGIDRGGNPGADGRNPGSQECRRLPPDKHGPPDAGSAERGPRSIFSTAPPKPEEQAAAQKSGVTCRHRSRPQASIPPSSTSTHRPNRTRRCAGERAGHGSLAHSSLHRGTAACTQGRSHPDARRIAATGEGCRSLHHAAAEPGCGPLPSEPPVQDFNAGRFSQPQAQAQEKTAALQPANPLRLQTPQPANPLSQTPDDGSRPVAKLNAFFPPKPAPAAVEGEGDDGTAPMTAATTANPLA